MNTIIPRRLSPLPRWLSSTLLGVALAAGVAVRAQTPQPANPQSSGPVKVDSATISGLGARNIGSAAMSGRIAAIDAVREGQRLTVYIGAASGGVWKSVNGGTTYKRSEEHTSELQSLRHLVCRLLLEKKKKKQSLYNRN